MNETGQVPSGGGEFSGFPDLAGLLLTEETVSGLLEMIVHLAVTGVPGVDGASVSLLVSEGQRMTTTNASSPLIREIDEAQYEGGKGPCVQAIHDGQEVSFSWPTEQWPVFARRAADGGVRSVWSLPLTVRGRSTGALNLYAMTDDRPEGPAQAVARTLAAQAAVVLTNAAALMSAELTNEHLRVALDTRDIIGQAKGILMARQAISSDEAFDILRRASQRGDRKLRDVAADIVARAQRSTAKA
jgi:GAF domain-containing protein